MKLYREDKEQAGYWDILDWIVDNYPDDIFVLENPQFLEIRDRARYLLDKKPNDRVYNPLNINNKTNNIKEN